MGLKRGATFVVLQPKSDEASVQGATCVRVSEASQGLDNVKQWS